MLFKPKVIIGGKPKVRIPLEMMLQALVFRCPVLVDQSVVKHCWNRQVRGCFVFQNVVLNFSRQQVAQRVSRHHEPVF
jgi:hypothetical protein